MKNMKGFCFFFVVVWIFFIIILLGCFLAESSVKSPQALGVRRSQNSSHQWDRVMGREAILKPLLGCYALLRGEEGSK